MKFRSKVLPNVSFVSAKPYLLAAFFLYLTSIFVVDYGADFLAFKIREFLDNFTNGSFFARFKLTILFDWIIYLGFFVVVVRSLIVYPRSFFFFNGYQEFKEESLWMSFFRVFRNCFLTSVVLILLFGILQGLLFWIPELFINSFADILNPGSEKTVIFREVLQDYYLRLFSWFNLSVIFQFLIRCGIFITIAQGLLITDGRKKLVSGFSVFAALFAAILLTSKFFPSRQYQEPQQKNYVFDNSFSGRLKEIERNRRAFEKAVSSCIKFPKEHHIEAENCEREIARIWKKFGKELPQKVSRDFIEAEINARYDEKADEARQLEDKMRIRYEEVLKSCNDRQNYFGSDGRKNCAREAKEAAEKDEKYLREINIRHGRTLNKPSRTEIEKEVMMELAQFPNLEAEEDYKFLNHYATDDGASRAKQVNIEVYDPSTGKTTSNKVISKP